MPLDHSLPLAKAKFNSMRLDDTLYKELTGSLNHPAICTRPDISLGISKLSQFNQNPMVTHLNATRRTLSPPSIFRSNMAEGKRCELMDMRTLIADPTLSIGNPQRDIYSK